jgi:hypothetical protein
MGILPMILLVLWDGHLADDFVSFVGWASCPSFGFLGRQDVHPTRFIVIFLDFWADRMSTPQDLF